MNCNVPIWLVSVRPADSDRAMPKSVNCTTRSSTQITTHTNAHGRTGLEAFLFNEQQQAPAAGATCSGSGESSAYTAATEPDMTGD